MSAGFSLLLIASGAILAFAVDYQAQGVDIRTVGIILFVAGLIGLALSVLLVTSVPPFSSRERYIERTTTDTRNPITRDHV